MFRVSSTDSLRVKSLLSLSVLLLTASAQAAAPQIEYVYPAGGQRGTTVDITVGQGKGDTKVTPWPAKVWSDGAGLTFEADKTANRFRVKIADDCPVGPHLIRVHNADGSSVPKVFVVGRHAETVEPEKASSEPRPVAKLPAVLNGQLAKSGEADTWAVEVEAGRWIVAELAAKRLGSPIDPFIQIVDPAGTVVALGNDDFGLDPVAVHRAEKSGRYLIHVAGFANPPGSEVRFAGSAATVYRMTVTTGPYARAAFPAVVGPGKSRVRLLGWNLPRGDEGVPIDVDIENAGGSTTYLDRTDIDNAVRLLTSPHAGVLEIEPNDAKPQAIELPARIDGRMQSPRDVDRYSITAKKGTKLTVAVRAAELDSPLDPVVTITDSAGKQLVREDDTGGVLRDPNAAWTVPADGDYTVAVSDLSRQGSPFHVYRLEIAPVAAGFTATADAEVVAVAPGKSGELKMKVAKQGDHAVAMKVEVEGLPKGVTVKSAEVPAKGGAVTVTLEADASAAGTSAAIRVWLTDGKDRKPATFALPAESMVPSTPWLWLTVGGSAERPAPKKR